MFTRACHMSLSPARLIHSTHALILVEIQEILPFTPICPKLLSFLLSLQNSVYIFRVSLRATCLAHLFVLDLTILINYHPDNFLWFPSVLPYTHVYLYVCVYICMYVCIYVCMCIYITTLACPSFHVSVFHFTNLTSLQLIHRH